MLFSTKYQMMVRWKFILPGLELKSPALRECEISLWRYIFIAMAVFHRFGGLRRLGAFCDHLYVIYFRVANFFSAVTKNCQNN